MRRSLYIALLGMLVAAAIQPRGSAQVDWSTAWMVQYRTAPGMAYDTARNRLVVFGGTCNGQSLADTWEWDGAEWKQLTPSVSPPARTGPTMTFDAARGVVVMFGGVAGAAVLNDTWEWDGSIWTQRFPQSQPAWGLDLTYDASRGRVVGAFFVFSLPNFSGQIWEWDGVDWSLRQTLAFPPNGIVYHAAQQVSVLTGWDSVAQVRRTLLWDGVSLTTAAPPPDSFPLMIEDPAHGVVLGMTGGDTWAWDGSQWSQVSQSSVTTQLRVTYDAVRQRPVAMGAGTTVEWDGANWNTVLPFPSPPGGGGGQDLAYDSIRDRAVYLGGGTWEWDGQRWERKFAVLEPPPRNGKAMTYSSSNGRVVLFGGYAPYPVALADTWLWDGTVWEQRFPSVSPPPRFDHAIAYDSQRDRVVLFGGSPDGSTNELGDTWEWDGTTWVQQITALSPFPRSGHGLAYDSARSRTVLFGGAGSNMTFQDTWEWDGATWTQRFPANSPSARHGAGMAFDVARARVVLFGGTQLGANDTWEWDGVDWTQRFPTNAPSPRSGAPLVYDSARRRITTHGGYGSAYDTWHYAPTDPASYTTSQSGCPGSAGTPALTSTSPSGFPWLGEPFAVLVTIAAPGSAVAMAVGLSNTAWTGVPLPLALDFVGMTGCQAYTSAELYFPVGIADATGTATWNLGVLPNDPGFLGFRFFAQAWVMDDVNPAGLVVSDLGEAVVGGK